MSAPVGSKGNLSLLDIFSLPPGDEQAHGGSSFTLQLSRASFPEAFDIGAPRLRALRSLHLREPHASHLEHESRRAKTAGQSGRALAGCWDMGSPSGPCFSRCVLAFLGFGPFVVGAAKTVGCLQAQTKGCTGHQRYEDCLVKIVYFFDGRDDRIHRDGCSLKVVGDPRARLTFPCFTTKTESQHMRKS